MDCPRCGVPLVAGVVADERVDGCPRCRGTLLDRARLPALLGKIGPRPTKDLLDDPPIRVPDVGAGTATCPRCGVAMARHGYMESPFVLVDRCSACDVVWVDDGELPAMAHQLARVRARSDEADVHRKEMAEQSVLHWRFDPNRSSDY